MGPPVGGAVQRAGDDAGSGGLAHAADAGEHEGVRDATGGEGVAQDAHHRGLTDEVIEASRAILACEHAIGDGLHRLRSGAAEQARAFGGRRWLELLIAVEQAGHAGQIQPPRRPS